MSQLINDIKKKKELQDISNKFVKDELRNYLKKNFKAKKFLAGEFSTRSSYYKKIIKDVRTQLRRSYGLFRKKSKVDLSKIKDFKEVLESHSSTRERISLYKEIYKKIFATAGPVETILDFGCGLNPFSYKFLPEKNITYFAYDLAVNEIKLINDYFKKSKIKGGARILNVLQTNKIKKLPKADLAFLFKMTDVLDNGKGHKKTEEVIKAIPAKYIVVSFPTLTMSGKKMNFPRRKWIELMSERLGYFFKHFEISNEIFYIIEKR